MSSRQCITAGIKLNRGNGPAALKDALRSGVRKQGLLRNMLYYMLLLKSDFQLFFEAEKGMYHFGEEDFIRE